MVLGTPKFAMHRAGSQLGVLITATATAVAVATLLVLAVALPPRVAGTTYRLMVTEEPANHVMRASTAFDAETWQEVDRSVSDAVAASGLPFSTSATTWMPTFTSPVLPENTNVVIGSMSDVSRRAELITGRWPTRGPDMNVSGTEVVMHEAALDATGLGIGDEFVVTPFTSEETRATTIVGAFRPTDPDDPVWRDLGHGVIPGSDQKVTLIGPLLADQGDVVENLALTSGTAAWTMQLDVAEVPYSDGKAAIAAVEQIKSDVEAIPLGSVIVNTRLEDHLDTAYSAANSARSVLLGAVAMLAVLAIWALIFTARLVAARRSAATALLRARGVSPSVLTLWSAVGALPFAAVVMIAAPALATLGVEWLTSTGTVDNTGALPVASPASWLMAIVASLSWLALLVAVDYSAGRSMASVDIEHSRPPRRAAVQRAGLDVVALGLAALGLQQLRRPAGDASDIVLMLAPTVIVLAGAMILVRILPWIGRIASAITTHMRGFSASLGTLDLARRPLRHSAAAVLLILALAVSIVTSATNSTWNDFRDDVVALSEPVDVRVSTNRDAHPGRIRADIESLTGVEAVTPVARFGAAADETRADVVVIDADEGRSVLRADGDYSAAFDAISDTGQMTAVVTTSYADFYGYKTGDHVIVEVGSAVLDFEIGEIVATVPGTASEYAMLLNRNASRLASFDTDPTLEQHEGRPDCNFVFQGDKPPLKESVEWCADRLTRNALWPDEWWISTTDGQLPPGAEDVTGATAVHSNALALADSRDDPATAGVLNALSGTLGFTTIFLLIGSIVQAVSSYRARANEHAQLRAMGFSGRSTLTATTIEHVLLLAFAAVAGVGLGTFVAWVTVPHTVGGLARLPAVPPLQFSLPWVVAAVLTAALTALMAVVVIVVSAGLRRVNIVAVLREGGE
jgi:hypothetical protein